MRRLLILIMAMIALEGSCQDRYIDSLLQIYRNSQVDNIRYEVLINASRDAILNRSFERSDSLVQALKLYSNKMDNPLDKVEAYYWSGINKYYQRKGLEVIPDLKIADSIFQENDRPSDALSCINIIANVQVTTGNYTDAIETYLRGLKIAEAEQDTIYLAALSSNIGFNNYRLKYYEQSLTYYFKALHLYEALGDTTNVALRLRGIATSYDEMDSSRLAEVNFLESRRLFNLIKDNNNLLLLNDDLGAFYLNQGRFEEANEIYANSVEQAESYNDLHFKASFFKNYGLSLYYAERPQAAIKNLERANIYAKKGNHFQQLVASQYELSKVLFEKKNFEKAYRNIRNSYDLKDSLFVEDAQKQVIEIEEKYENEKKERQIAEQNLEIANQQASIQEQNLQIGSLGAGLIIVILAGLFYYNQYRNKQNSLLQEVVISEQQKGLRAVFQATEEERQRIARDLHDGLGQQLAALKMSFQQFSSEPNSKDQKKVGALIDEAARDAREISHQMMPRSLVEFGLIKAIEDTLDKTLGSSNIQYEFEKFNLQDRYDERIEVTLFRIFQELTSNIIKHAKASMVNVQLFQNQNKLLLIVEDNGTGLTGNTSEGHGLLNIKNRLDIIKGKVNLEPSPESGTTATISVPL